MAKADSIIDALEKYFIGCELLKDGALRVDYLGEKPVEYTIEVLPCDPVVKRYLGGSTVRQYLFAFGSREFYSQERLQNIQTGWKPRACQGFSRNFRTEWKLSNSK